jgi:hypothetical protein
MGDKLAIWVVKLTHYTLEPVALLGRIPSFLVNAITPAFMKHPYCTGFGAVEVKDSV